MKRTCTLVAICCLLFASTHAADSDTPPQPLTAPAHNQSPDQVRTVYPINDLIRRLRAHEAYRKPPYGESGSLRHVAGATKDLAHGYTSALSGFGMFLVSYLGQVCQALALTSKNPIALRGLYTTALATRTIDGTANVLAALTPTNEQSRLSNVVEETGYELQYGGPSYTGRIIRLVFGGLQLSRVPFNLKLLANAGKLSRLYKQQPRLMKSLKKIRNRRLKNATISLLVTLAIAFTIDFVTSRIHMANREDEAALRIGSAMLLSSLVSGLFLNRRGEERGIENELVMHAKRLAKEQAQPFFNPPQQSMNGLSHASSSKLKPDEMQFGAINGDVFDDLDED